MTVSKRFHPKLVFLKIILGHYPMHPIAKNTRILIFNAPASINDRNDAFLRFEVFEHLKSSRTSFNRVV